MEYQVYHNEAAQRFEAEIEGKVAFIQYELLPEGVDFVSTYVPAELTGQGVGSALAGYVLQYAREHQWHVEASCPFIQAYIERHPEAVGES